MLVIGLTGGIGMGKTSAAAHLRRLGMKVFDADAYVHRLYEGDAVEAVEAAFPGTTRDGQVDRALLAAEVAGKPERLRQLEAIIHHCAQRLRGRAADPRTGAVRHDGEKI